MRNRKVNAKISISVLSILISYQCEKPDRSVGFVYNMSKHTVTLGMSNNYPDVDPLYPDTVLPIKNTTFGGSILPQQRGNILEKTVSWSSIYNVNADSDTISFFIYDVDTLDKYPWEVIRKNYMILQRYDLSIYDMRKLDFKLYYPPTEAMRNMKMYPAYEE